MNFAWYINRLKSMSPGEILWRLSQRKLQGQESRRFADFDTGVTDTLFEEAEKERVFSASVLPVAPPEDIASYVEEGRLKSECAEGIRLLGGCSYNAYAKLWNAGFQTENCWEDTFSYDLKYRQRDDIGDARTNWELSRHFQFSVLAMGYYRTGETHFLEKLCEVFNDYNDKNPFLHGISWTSVMEVAIRAISWMYTLTLLDRSRARLDETRDEFELKCIESVAVRLDTGIQNMTDYVAGHYSRFSSANNHVIVEAVCLGLAGLCYRDSRWLDTCIGILNREIPGQNYDDGVNKEQSLHYQAFFMEAVGLLCLTMLKNEVAIPDEWLVCLTAMARYLSDCRGDYGEIMAFGDDDDGKVFDLAGVLYERDSYDLVLTLMSLVLRERYVDDIKDPTLLLMLERADFERVSKRRDRYHPEAVSCRRQGGITLIKKNEAFIGIDHGPLGFGSIAAHGHADALSFQLWLKGHPVFCDPGSFIYHIDIDRRNADRATASHNTISLDGQDQSRMLGAFLWGRKARCRIISFETGKGFVRLKAEHNGYAPVIHRRSFSYDEYEHSLTIEDELTGVRRPVAWRFNLLLACEYTGLMQKTSHLSFRTDIGCRIDLDMSGEAHFKWEDTVRSTAYACEVPAKRLFVEGSAEADTFIKTVIRWQDI